MRIREARNILAVHKQSNPLESEIMQIQDEIVRKVPYNIGQQWVKRVTVVYEEMFDDSPKYSRKFHSWIAFDHKERPRPRFTLLSCLRDVCMLDMNNRAASFAPLFSNRFNHGAGGNYILVRDTVWFDAELSQVTLSAPNACIELADGSLAKILGSVPARVPIRSRTGKLQLYLTRVECY